MIEYRSLQRMAFMMVITLGLYSIFLFYWLSREMLAYNGRTGYPGLWIVGLGLFSTIPFIHAIPAWKFAELVHLTSKGRYNRLFLIAGIMTIVLIPIILLLTQRLLNGIALEQRAGVGGEQPGEAQMDEEQMGGVAPGDARVSRESLEGAAPAGEQADEELPPEPGESAPHDEPGDEPYIKSDDIRTIGR